MKHSVAYVFQVLTEYSQKRSGRYFIGGCTRRDQQQGSHELQLWTGERFAGCLRLSRYILVSCTLQLLADVD